MRRVPIPRSQSRIQKMSRNEIKCMHLLVKEYVIKSALVPMQTQRIKNPVFGQRQLPRAFLALEFQQRVRESTISGGEKYTCWQA
jgi:hypothetical protein